MANPQEELKQQQAIVNEIKQQLQLYNELVAKKKELGQSDYRALTDLNKQLNAWKQLNKSIDRVKNDLSEAEGELKSLSKEAEKAAKALEAQAKAVDDLSDNFSDLNAFQRSITRQYGEQSDETKRINKNVDAIKAATGGVGKFLKKNVNLEEDQRDALIEASDYLKNMPSSFDKLNKQVSRGTINQKKYNQYVAELSDNWEEILDKINDSGKGLGGMKKALREMGKAQGLSGEASQRYEQLLKFEERQKSTSAITGAALSGIPGGEGINQLLEANHARKAGYSADSQKLKRTLAGAAIGAAVTDFAMSMREYIPALSKQYYKLANYYAPLLAGRQEDVNIQAAKFNRDAKLFGGPLSKKYGRGMYYAAEAAKEFDFKMQSLNVEFSKAAKTAFFGRGIGSVGYNASQMQLAGVGAESVASAITDIASGANVNFFGTTLGSQAAVFSKQMGISTQSIGDIMAAFRRIDGSSGKTALNMVYTSAKMADIAKLNPAVILQDMAEASGKMLSYNIQNAKSFQQQAIALRQMGGNLPKFAEGITGSILNYRQSLQAQISLSNMLNRPVDFSVAQSLAYQGKYSEAFANVKQSGVLESVRKAGPLAAAQFQQIFGMGIDEFQARAEGGKSMGLAGTMDAENKAFLKRVSGAEKASMIAEAKITVTKAVVDAEFAKALAVGLNENPAYRKAVTSLDALSVASNKLESIISAIVTGLGAAAGGYLLRGTVGKMSTPGAAAGKVSGAPSVAALGGNFAGYKVTGTGANQLVRNAKGQIVSAAEAKAFKDASKLAKYSKYGKVAGKGLGALGVGLDVYGRVSEGQTMTQTAAGVGAGLAGAYGGAQLGASIGALGGPLAPFTVPLGGLIGGGLGYFIGGKTADMVTGVGKPKQQEQVKQQQQVQTALDEGTQLLTVVKNIELLVAEMAGYQATPAVVQMIMDGKDISNSLVKHQLNSRGQKKETTLKQSLGWYR
jgi:uncharacterized protein YfkK (UPF0435 family)